jgi:hypothetical protein
MLPCDLMNEQMDVMWRFVGEFNDCITRMQVRQSMDALVRRHIDVKEISHDTMIICDEINNTPDAIDNNEFVVWTFLRPYKSTQNIRYEIRLGPNCNFAIRIF